ncbi:uncharacterized protein LOC133500885 isoform X2 [Syngnathoides biaculeatus]|nr:uncharacterized protein LOC133500885 isoform X2 [Syngnathoides biaculeatus]
MQPISLPAGDELLYNIEKRFMRQFVILARQNRVPPNILPEHMKLWLLQNRNIPHQFREMQTRVDARMFNLLCVAWTKARILCLHKMEREVCMDLDEEGRLSQLLGRTVTLEGLQKYITLVRPQAERDTEIFLQCLFSELQQSLGSVVLSSTQRMRLCEKFHRATEPLVQETVDVLLDYLLDDLEPLANEESSTAMFARRYEGACKEIGRMLTNAVVSIPCLCQNISLNDLLYICTAMAWRMTRRFFKNFIDCSANFDQLDLDDSSVADRDRVTRAIVEMVYMANQ